MTTTGGPRSSLDSQRRAVPSKRAWALSACFATLAFFQGMSEPSEGLPGQPVRSLLKGWGLRTSEITGFAALLAIPWLLKPLFGLLTDFVPLGGSRRKGYLVATSVLSATSLLGLFVFPVAWGARHDLLARLWIASTALACADVVADALLVERGQALGMTGPFQAAEWGSLYLAGIVIGEVGGLLAERHLERWAFLISGLGAVATLLLSLLGIREPSVPPSRPGPREALGALGRAARSPVVAGVGGFLFLWNFNPFSNAVLHLHMTRGMGFGERFYGHSATVSSVASIAASLAYGAYCRRFSTIALVHASIALGVASTLGYALMTDGRSAMIVTAVVGFAYMSATLIQLDLAARTCPREAAGTVFAILMALENLAASLSTWLGGLFYEECAGRWGSRASFVALVVVGSAFTASCWPLVLLLPGDVFRRRDVGEGEGPGRTGMRSA